ncbi:hypothetical protein PR202_ga14553 [Eleusine coracana subsp. coracana]|uniref:Uncharacterized protein n=1 Tax=Eleusine coracana subsp. coracana TaxID=191504 RepID=A0AAV5CGY2_ELECO|nr:hypothetical protein PR202_ga14553 [Eleusine coracana subsp. coracana]
MHLLRLWSTPTFPQFRRRRSPPPNSLVLIPKRLRFSPRAHGSHVRYIRRHYHHLQHQHHRHGHCNCHGHHKVDVHGGGGGAAVMRVARAIGWAGVADKLREHLQACCFSLGLLLIAAACPHVAPLRSVKLLPAALNAVAFPLVGVIMTTTLLCFFVDHHNQYQSHGGITLQHNASLRSSGCDGAGKLC